MSRFCLRYQAMDLSLASGELVAGRALECGLVLDDSAVSRKHAVFRDRADHVEVEDLGSRNGVLVNDVRIDKATRLRHGDRVRIGAQELTLKDTELAQNRPGTAELAQCQACHEVVPLEATCRACGATLAQASPSDSPPPLAASSSSSRALGSLTVVTQLADKAIGLGRFDDAERLLQNPLTQLLQSVSSRPDQATSLPVDRKLLGAATHEAMRLAEGLNKTAWVDYAFDLYTAAGVLMPAELIEELYRVAAKVRYASPRPIRAYLARLRADGGPGSAADRFLVQRLEGLERRVGSG